MLKEKKGLTTWEKALTELIYDDRYAALPKEYRKLVFDDYMKKNKVIRMREEVKAKEEIGEEVHRVMEKYRKEGKIIANMEYRKFEEIVKNDVQFLKILKADKESVLREFINEVTKAKDEVRLMQVKKFKEMLKEIDKTSIKEDTKWEEVKKRFKNDERYRAIGSKTQREKLYLEYLAEVMSEREEELILTRKREAPEESHSTKEQERIFKELLSDYIKQPNLTWLDAAKLIEKDKRYGELSGYIASMPYAYKDFMRNYKYFFTLH
jgi:hypothetical protein